VTAPSRICLRGRELYFEIFNKSEKQLNLASIMQSSHAITRAQSGGAGTGVGMRYRAGAGKGPGAGARAWARGRRRVHKKKWRQNQPPTSQLGAIFQVKMKRNS